jgi:5-formyltetrahydrofolate cyclo-ligase
MRSAVPEETRNGLRSAILKRRRALSPATCLFWSRSIQAKVLELPQYLAAPSLVLYCAAGNEVETRAIMDHALGHGKKVFCPKLSAHHPVAFAQIFSEADLIPGPLGILEPVGDVHPVEDDPGDLMVIVPGLLFDIQGNRLGRGGGWYDRALHRFEGRGVFVGLAYEFQVVDKIPAQSWDKKVHYVATESRVIACGLTPQ